MNSNVKSDVVYSNYQGNTSTFIKEIIGEMKYQFNKSEYKNGVAKTENNEVKKVNMEIDDIKEEKVGERKSTSESDNSELNQILSVENDSDNSESKVESPLFKRPNDELLHTNNKGPSPSKRPVRQKDDTVKHTVKRSLRCRGKNSSESILQSAIARKEKSYNESNKPQRLSRQKKITKKIFENMGQDKLENIKENSSNDMHYSDDTSTSDGGMKIQKTTKSFKKKIKKLRSNLNDELESDSLESTFDSCEDLKVTRQQTQKNKECDNKDAENVKQNNSVVNTELSAEFVDSSSIEHQLIASRLCLCTQKTMLFADVKENDIMYCTAIDSIEEKLVGCSRIADVKSIPLLRPSRRVPYQIMCDFHKNRLIRHNCCPTCGIFCTQGRFVECKSKHQYHRKCQVSVGTIDCCPHCGVLTPSSDVFIKLHCDKKPIFLPTQKPN